MDHRELRCDSIELQSLPDAELVELNLRDVHGLIPECWSGLSGFGVRRPHEASLPDAIRAIVQLAANPLMW